MTYHQGQDLPMNELKALRSHRIIILSALMMNSLPKMPLLLTVLKSSASETAILIELFRKSPETACGGEPDKAMIYEMMVAIMNSSSPIKHYTLLCELDSDLVLNLLIQSCDVRALQPSPTRSPNFSRQHEMKLKHQKIMKKMTNKKTQAIKVIFQTQSLYHLNTTNPEPRKGY